jgi:hypothetical protein
MMTKVYTLRIMTVPNTESTINNKAVQTAAKEAALSTPFAVLFPLASLFAQTHETMKATKTKT